MPRWAVGAAGAVLVALGIFLWFERIGPRDLAIANAATAVAAVLWLVLASGFSPAGTAVVTLTAVVLLGLALAEAATLRS